MSGSATATDEKNAWIYAFVILFIVSMAMLGLRLSGRQFLVTEFEITIIYFPTVLSGVISAYVTLKGPK
jgi:hypothetical protein